MFHAPEFARLINHPHLASKKEDGNNGAFFLDSNVLSWKLACIVSDEGGWEHVSVHAFNKIGDMRTPFWSEMCRIKNMFWDEEDVVIQYHPKKSEYVNNHPYVLHLWRPINIEIPTPPSIYVGIK